MKTHKPAQETRKIACEICGLEASSELTIEKHIEELHTCLQCNTLWGDFYELNRHKEIKHSRKFECKECGYKCNSDREIKEHLTSHEGINHRCEVCGQSRKFWG